MTEAERHAAISEMIKRYKAANTVSKAAARKALMKTGIYTSDGELREELGGKPKKKAKAAA